MLEFFRAVLSALRAFFRSRRDTMLEILALRQAEVRPFALSLWPFTGSC
jgi:hypothetical protein